MIWKILTAQIREEIYNSLKCRGLLPKEQELCCEGKREIDDQLYTDKHIHKEVKTRRKNVAMVWIDYKEACDKSCKLE